MATGLPVDPYLNFNFLVEIQGITRAAFQEASGFDSSIDVTEYREGGGNTTPYKLPAQTKYSNITLKRGITDDTELFDWHQQFVTGDPAASRKNGSIVLSHDIHPGTIEAMPSTFDALEAKGFRFVTVSELIHAAVPQQPPPSPGTHERFPAAITPSPSVSIAPSPSS